MGGDHVPSQDATGRYHKVLWFCDNCCTKQLQFGPAIDVAEAREQIENDARGYNDFWVVTMQFIYIYRDDMLIETLYCTEAEARQIRKHKIAQGFDVVLVHSFRT